MLSRLDRLGRAVLDFVLPQSCLCCGLPGDALCVPCRDRWPRVVPPYCPICGLPQVDARACPDCSKQDFILSSLRSVFIFEKQVRVAILQFKYRNLRTLARPLAEALSVYLSAHPLPVDALVPVPLHPRKMRQRGYNQSALLTGELAKLTGLPVAGGILLKHLNTPAQASLARAGQRRLNVEHAFAAGRNLPPNLNILLIDDIATTGATLNACARTLKEAGAASVRGLTLAREIL